MKKTIIAFAAIAALFTSLQARTWTSSDGSKTFEGNLRTFDSDSGTVTVIMANGKSASFPQDKLSEADVAFLKEWEATKNQPDPAEVAASSEVGSKVVKAKLNRLEGKRFKKAELTKAPEYYILYYSASW
jgi:hypothetical protein